MSSAPLSPPSSPSRSVIDRSISVLSEAGEAIGQRVKRTEAPLMRKIMRGCNVLNACGVLASGLVRLATLGGCTGECPLESNLVAGVYSMIFGGLLLIFEVRVGEKYDAAVRRNCGFLYSLTGMTYFLLFIATLLFSVPMFTSDAPPLWWVSLLVGLFTTTNAVLHCFVRRYHPTFAAGDYEQIGRDDDEADFYGGINAPATPDTVATDDRNGNPFTGVAIEHPTFGDAGKSSLMSADTKAEGGSLLAGQSQIELNTDDIANPFAVPLPVVLPAGEK